MSNFKNDANEIYDNVKQQAEKTTNDLRGTVRDGVSQAKDLASDARDYIRDKGADAETKLHEFGGKVRDGFDRVRHMDSSDIEDTWECVKNKVRDNPGVALAIAAGAGLVIGLVCSLKGNSNRKY